MPQMTRRDFVGYTVGSALAGLAGRAVVAQQAEGKLGANERISVGLVGLGNRCRSLTTQIEELAIPENVAITAVCDIWEKRRETVAAEIEARNGRPVRRCRKMAEICDLPDVDVLVVATPDFQHASLTRQAVEAEKDVYVEKPFGCDFDQIKQARDAVKKSGRIVQVGTQQRARGVPWAAREFIRNGRLGKVSYVEMSQPMFMQRWRIPGAETALTEKDTDWNEFLCYLPSTPFNARHYTEFRLFWPYSTGIFCQWMSHQVDLINLILDEQPKAVTAVGGVYVWNDGRNNPDTAHCLIEYPSGCLFSYHMRLGNGADRREMTFYGTNGTLDLGSGLAYGDGGGGEVILKNPGGIIPDFITDAGTRLPGRERGGVILDAEPDGNHMADFLQAVRSRRQPRADIDAAFNHALATTMAGMSWRMGTRVEYDRLRNVVSPTETDWKKSKANLPFQA